LAGGKGEGGLAELKNLVRKEKSPTVDSRNDTGEKKRDFIDEHRFRQREGLICKIGEEHLRTDSGRDGDAESVRGRLHRKRKEKFIPPTEGKECLLFNATAGAGGHCNEKEIGKERNDSGKVQTCELKRLPTTF